MNRQGAVPRRHRVLVTDGEQRSALAAVRSLGRAGHRAFVCSARARPLAAASRHASDSALVPDPLRVPAAFAETVGALARRWEVDVVFPMTDASMLAALDAPGALAPATVPFGSLDAYRAITDKRALLAAAPDFGIAVPAQHTLCCADPRSLEALDITYPVVVKPARSVGEHAGRRDRFNVRYAADADALATIVGTSDPAAFPLLLQQRVVGPGVGIFLLRWEGATIAAFSHRRLREKPPSGGVSVYRESIAADPGLLARSEALLAHFGWSGVAMIEYKLDAATGTPYLMEINGRFWGSLQLAIDAGVDFPTLLLAAMDGTPPARQPPYATGVRSRWWWGDVDQLLTRLRHPARALALPPDAPTRWGACREFCRVWNPADRNEILQRDDPAPFLRETADWLLRDLFRWPS